MNPQGRPISPLGNNLWEVEAGPSRPTHGPPNRLPLQQKCFSASLQLQPKGQIKSLPTAPPSTMQRQHSASSPCPTLCMVGVGRAGLTLLLIPDPAELCIPLISADMWPESPSLTSSNPAFSRIFSSISSPMSGCPGNPNTLPLALALSRLSPWTYPLGSASTET